MKLGSTIAERAKELHSLKSSTIWTPTSPLRKYRNRFPSLPGQTGKIAGLVSQLLSRVKTRQRHLDGRTISLSALFDRNWYLDRYPDVQIAAIDPALHYFDHGARERRNPSALFDTAWYLSKYPDVAN